MGISHLRKTKSPEVISDYTHGHCVCRGALAVLYSCPCSLLYYFSMLTIKLGKYALKFSTSIICKCEKWNSRSLCVGFLHIV